MIKMTNDDRFDVDCGLYKLYNKPMDKESYKTFLEYNSKLYDVSKDEIESETQKILKVRDEALKNNG